MAVTVVSTASPGSTCSRTFSVMSVTSSLWSCGGLRTRCAGSFVSRCGGCAPISRLGPRRARRSAACPGVDDRGRPRRRPVPGHRADITRRPRPRARLARPGHADPGPRLPGDGLDALVPDAARVAAREFPRRGGPSCSPAVRARSRRRRWRRPGRGHATAGSGSRAVGVGHRHRPCRLGHGPRGADRARVFATHFVLVPPRRGRGRRRLVHVGHAGHREQHRPHRRALRAGAPARSRRRRCSRRRRRSTATASPGARAPVLALVAAAPALGAAEAAVELYRQRLADASWPTRSAIGRPSNRRRRSAWPPPSSDWRRPGPIGTPRSRSLGAAAMAGTSTTPSGSTPGWPRQRRSARLARSISTVCEGSGASVYLSSRRSSACSATSRR